MKPIWWRDPSALLNFRIYLRQPPSKTSNYVEPRHPDFGHKENTIPLYPSSDGRVDLLTDFLCYKNIKPGFGVFVNISEYYHTICCNIIMGTAESWWKVLLVHSWSASIKDRYVKSSPWLRQEIMISEYHFATSEGIWTVIQLLHTTKAHNTKY